MIGCPTCATLFSFGELHFCGQTHVGAQHLHLHLFPGLVGAERVREIVEVLNRVLSELHQDVARLQAGFGRGGPGVTSANRTPRGGSAKSGILPKYGP